MSKKDSEIIERAAYRVLDVYGHKRIVVYVHMYKYVSILC